MIQQAVNPPIEQRRAEMAFGGSRASVRARAGLIAVVMLLLTACATHTVKSTSYTPIVRGEAVPEALNRLFYQCVYSV